MKPGLWLAFSLFLVFLFIRADAQPNDIIIKKLSSYFLDNKVPLSNGTNYMVITKEKQFNKLFGVAKTMNNTIYYPNFKKEVIVVLVLPETNKETKIEYINAIKAGNFVEVYYKIKRSYPLTYTLKPIALAVIPKYPGVNTYKFYEGKKLLRVEKMK